MGQGGQWIAASLVENGSFLLSLVSALLTALGILLALSGVIAYIRVKSAARAIAVEEARNTAQAIAEKAANDYLRLKSRL